MTSVPDRGGGTEPPIGSAADESGSEVRSQPRPEPDTRRQRFRRWRGTRPFWAGLWTLLAGLELALIPLSDIGQFFSAGQVAFTAALPGVVLVIAGAFMWFSPPNRTLAGLLAMVFAVASLVLSNLGGLLIGMMLGIVGGAMAVGWTDAPRRSRGRVRAVPDEDADRGRGAVPVVLVLVASLLTLPSAERADARGHCILSNPLAELAPGLADLGSDLLADGGLCLVDLEDLDSSVLSDIVATLDAGAAADLVDSISATDLVANAAGLDPVLVASVLDTLAGEISLTTLETERPTGTDLLDAVARSLPTAPIDLVSLLELVEDTLAGTVDASDLLARLLDLLTGIVDDVGTRPSPGDEPETPTGSATPRAVDATPTVSGPGHDDGHRAPSVLSILVLDTLDVDTLRYVGIVSVPTGDGPLDVMRFEIDEIDASGLDLILPDGVAADFGIANTPGGSLHGDGVVLDCTRLALEITGAGGLVGLPLGLPIELTPSSPLLDVLGPILAVAPAGTVLSTRDVDIDLVTLSVQTLDLIGVAGGAS